MASTRKRCTATIPIAGEVRASQLDNLVEGRRGQFDSAWLSRVTRPDWRTIMNATTGSIASAVSDLRATPLGQLSGQSLSDLMKNLSNSSVTTLSFSSRV